jgi:uncharacterized repeat protein (TIGR03809 family)
MVKATVRLENVALKWRALAERRRDHHLELYKSGRWKRYYTEQQFIAERRSAGRRSRRARKSWCCSSSRRRSGRPDHATADFLSPSTPLRCRSHGVFDG